MVVCNKMLTRVGHLRTLYMEIVSPSSRVNPIRKKDYPARGINSGWKVFCVNAYRRLTVIGFPGECGDSTRGCVKRLLIKGTALARTFLQAVCRTNYGS